MTRCSGRHVERFLTLHVHQRLRYGTLTKFWRKQIQRGIQIRGRINVPDGLMSKHYISERDICAKFTTPVVRQPGGDEMTQTRGEFSFTKGRIIVRGKLVTQGRNDR